MQSFTQQYFNSNGAAAPAAHENGARVSAALHLNEMPHDIPTALRESILEAARTTALNRYPETFATSLATKLAGWYGCSAKQVIVGPGSSGFLRMLLTYFGLHIRGKLVITRPSFAYYEQFCRAFRIAYETWDLDDNFQYDLRGLEHLPDYSVVCLTNPNNPTGNLISPAQLQSLLERHPTSLFIVDEAYVDFIDYTMLPLMAAHDNLLLLRTFSKAFAAAGIRCGILVGSPALVQALSALQTPWQLSAFTIEAAKLMIDFAQQTTWLRDQVREVIAERERLSRNCIEACSDEFTVFPSDANFLLFRARTPEGHASLLQACVARGIQILDLHEQPRTARCVRVSIGRPGENRLFFAAFIEAITCTTREAFSR